MLYQACPRKPNKQAHVEAGYAHSRQHTQVYASVIHCLFQLFDSYAHANKNSVLYVGFLNAMQACQ